MIQLHSDGLKPTEIAKAVGCSRMQVYRILDGRAKLQHEPTDSAVC
ncbi:helix-turn-helix domain-containing protein [Mesorhizobium sp. LSHC426A00]